MRDTGVRIIGPVGTGKGQMTTFSPKLNINQRGKKKGNYLRKDKENCLLQPLSWLHRAGGKAYLI